MGLGGVGGFPCVRKEVPLLLVLLAWAFSRWVPGAMPYPLHWL